MKNLKTLKPAVGALSMAALLSLAACSSEDTPNAPDVPQVKSGELQFNTSIKSSSRANMTTTFGQNNTNPISDFAVYAYQTPTTGTAAWLTEMGKTGAGILVKGKSSVPGYTDSAWEFSWDYKTNKQPWAEITNGSSLEFFAFSPALTAEGMYDAAGAAFTDFTTQKPNDIFGTTNPAAHEFTYQVPTDTKKQIDFLLAYTKKENVNPDVEPVIPLRFQHALSRVTVAVRMANGMTPDGKYQGSDPTSTYYEVKDIKFFNFADKATFAMKADEATSAPSNGIPGNSEGNNSSSFGWQYANDKTNWTILWKDWNAKTVSYDYSGLNKVITMFDDQNNTFNEVVVQKAKYKSNTAEAIGTTDPNTQKTTYNGYISMMDLSINDALMVIPQTLDMPKNSGEKVTTDPVANDGAYLKIVYTIHRDENGADVATGADAIKYNLTKYLPIYQTKVDQDGTKETIPFTFEIGRQYRFLIDLAELDHMVHFRVIATDWDDVQDNQVVETIM